MLTFSSQFKIYLARDPVDMRKSHDGLYGVVRETLRQDPMSGHYFVFFNRRRNRVKILVWEEGGFWLFYKRLEQGTFEIPRYLDHGKGCLEVDRWQLELIFSGISVKEVSQRKRYYGYVRSRKADSRRSPASIPQGQPLCRGVGPGS